MQPNLTQDAKFNPDNKAEIVARYLALSDRATGPNRTGLGDITTLIWPESSFPFILSRDPQALAQIGDALPTGTILVTGAARAEVGPQGRPRYFNAVQVLAHGGVILDSADKVHLVPFGEYLPFDGVLTRLGLHHFVNIPGGFEAGVVHRLIDVPGLPPVAPLICYEAIFPGAVVPREGPRPGLLLNLTDDGWFGRTAGPYQHLAQARLRTIEEGLPLVRAATTGISAIIDPYGRILESLSLGAEGVLDGNLPKALAPPLAARSPFLPGFALWIACLVAACFGLWGGRRT
jgi:apolipoprotein N-acyltransferase